MRPGRHPTWPSTLIAGIEYSTRMFSNQSAHRVSTFRSGSMMRWFVVTPPIAGSENGFTSSRSVSVVQIVSLSTSTTMSPVHSVRPTSIALRFPGTAVHIQCTPG